MNTETHSTYDSVHKDLCKQKPDTGPAWIGEVGRKLRIYWQLMKASGGRVKFFLLGNTWQVDQTPGHKGPPTRSTWEV